MAFREIIIGNTGSDFVGILPAAPNLEGWFTAKIRVNCEGFKNSFNASFMKGELEGFAEELDSLHTNLRGTARFEPMEPWLNLFCTGDGRGHVQVRGEAQSIMGSATFLTFSFDIDQTYIPKIVEALRAGNSSVRP